MNEQVEQKANELLLGLIDKAQAGMEFAEAQIPDVVNQLLMWHLVRSAILVSACVFVGAVLAWRIYATHKSYRSKGWAEYHGSYLPEAFALNVVCAGGIVVALSFIFNPLLIALQIWLAPKLYLLEYAASLAK